MWRRPLAESGASVGSMVFRDDGQLLVGSVLTADYRGLSTGSGALTALLPVTLQGRVLTTTSLAAIPDAGGSISPGHVGSRWDGGTDVTSLIGHARDEGALKRVTANGSVVIDIAVTSDVSGDGAQEAAVLQILATGEVVTKAWSLKSGQPFRSLRFATRYQPLSLLHFADEAGGLGTQALGVLGVDDSGSARIQIKSFPDGEQISVAWFGSAYQPLQVMVLPDFTGNNAEEMALLGINETGVARVKLKDGLTGLGIRSLFFGRPAAVHGFTVLPDLNANGSPEIGVLLTKASGARVLKIRDARTGTIIDVIGFSTDFYPASVVTIPDAGNGVLAVGVLGEDFAGRKRMQLRDVRTGKNIDNLFFSRDRAPEDVAVLDDQNGNGAMEVAVVTRDGYGEAQVEVRDSLSRVRLGIYPLE
jgi:hypothetical protein